MNDPDSTQIKSAAWVQTKHCGRTLVVEFRSKGGFGGYTPGVLIYEPNGKRNFHLDTDFALSGNYSAIGRQEYRERITPNKGTIPEDVTADFKAEFTKLHNPSQ